MAFPLRTCVVCRQRAAKQKLVRFVAVVGAEELRGSERGSAKFRLELDLGETKQGRASYCHRSRDCLSGQQSLSRVVGSVSRGSTENSRRQLVPVEQESLLEFLRQGIEDTSEFVRQKFKSELNDLVSLLDSPIVARGTSRAGAECEDKRNGRKNSSGRKIETLAGNSNSTKSRMFPIRKKS